MLLKALHDFAQTRDLLKDLAFAQRPVRWIIELDETGGFLGVSQAGDDKRGKEFPCPQTTRAKTGAGVAEFLADGFTAVFGLESNPDAPRKAAEWKARLANNLTKRANFWRQIRRAAKECGSSNRLALLRCWKLTRSSKEPPPFLRWGTSTAPKAKEQNSWWMTLAGGGEVKLGAESFTIRIGNELLLDRPEFQDWWRKTHSRELAVLGEKNPRGICLVTSAENVVLALTHRPPIYGVPDTGSFGAPIVSFDKPAFQSYGLEQSLNAPTSDEAARAYATGLNWMLRNPDHHLRVGPATVVFWAKRTDSAARTIANFLKQPRPETVRKFLISPWSGMDDRMAKKDDFYAVTLGGNAGRIVVKRWVQEPLESAIDHISQWFRDLHLEVRPRLEPKPKKTGSKPPTEYHPLSIYWLACTTIRPDSKGKYDQADLRSELMANLYAAALEGTAPPVSLLKPILDQLQSRILRDENYRAIWDESRFSLLKLIINRHHRSRNEHNMQLEPKLTANTPDAAYNCGRLLSVFDSLQRAAHRAEAGAGSKLNTTLAERYFGSASSNPNGAFSLMWRLHMHHLKKLRQKGEKGQKSAAGYQRSIRDICRCFQAPGGESAPQFPRVFTLIQQGRFALGYYQQEAERAEQYWLWLERQKAAGKPPANAEDAETEFLFTEEDEPLNNPQQ